MKMNWRTKGPRNPDLWAHCSPLTLRKSRSGHGSPGVRTGLAVSCPGRGVPSRGTAGSSRLWVRPAPRGFPSWKLTRGYKEEAGPGRGEKSAWLLPLPCRSLLRPKLCPHAGLTPTLSPAPTTHCSQPCASKALLSFSTPGGQRGQGGRKRGENRLLSQLWEGGEGQGGRRGSEGRGGFWTRRRLFLSQERREYCLKQ